MKHKPNIIKAISSALSAFLLAGLLQVTPALAEQAVKNWPSKKTADVKKTWTVTLSSPADKNTVNGNNVYVLDEKNKKVTVKLALTSNNTKISVTPINAYSSTKKYRLILSNAIKAQNKKALTEKVIMPFTIDPAAKDSAISKVEIISATYVTAVKVITKNTVANVKCNGKLMHYSGKQVFELGLAGAKPGQTLTISAYDASGKLIISEKHQVK